MKTKLAVALAGGAALMVALTACEGDDGSEETEAWARQVCSESQRQVTKIRSASAAITEASEGDETPKEVQEVDSTAFQDISEAYAALADTVRKAGEPPVEDGATLRRDAVRELNSISDAYGELKETIDGLDTSDQAEFAEGLTGIAERLRQLGESGDEALSELQQGELGEAMAQQPGCQSATASPNEDGQNAGGQNEDGGN